MTETNKNRATINIKIYNSKVNSPNECPGRRDRDHMVVGFTTI